MTTRTALKAEIMDDMHRSSVADGTRVLAAISTAIKFYQPKRFFFNESRSVTFNTVASTDTYAFGTGLAITTEFYKIDGVWITISSSDIRELTQVHPEELEADANEITDTGEPSEWAFINKSLRLWRNPDDIYSVRIMGHVKLAEPATDGEANNAWMTEAYELIRCRAKYSLALHVWKDLELAGRMKAGMADALSSLNDATVDKFRTGFVTPTDF
jgi:hypothetical protein